MAESSGPDSESTPDARLRGRARLAYERGRARVAVRTAWPAAVLVLLVECRSGPRIWVLVLGGALVFTHALATYRSAAAGHAVLRGMLLGSAPLLAGTFRCPRLGECPGSGCLEFCVPVAAAATSLAWVLLRRAPGDLGRRVDVVLCAAGFTAAIAMSRDPAFVGGAIGLILGVGLTLHRGRASSP